MLLPIAACWLGSKPNSPPSSAAARHHSRPAPSPLVAARHRSSATASSPRRMCHHSSCARPAGYAPRAAQAETPRFRGERVLSVEANAFSSLSPPSPLPSLPYKVDTSRPSLRTNRTRRVPGDARDPTRAGTRSSVDAAWLSAPVRCVCTASGARPRPRPRSPPPLLPPVLSGHVSSLPPY